MHLARAARIEEQMGTADISRDREARAVEVSRPTSDVALIGPLSSGKLNLSGSPLLRGTVCMKFEAGVTS
jgi:hypothetical protein